MTFTMDIFLLAAVMVACFVLGTFFFSWVIMIRCHKADLMLDYKDPSGQIIPYIMWLDPNKTARESITDASKLTYILMRIHKHSLN